MKSVEAVTTTGDAAFAVDLDGRITAWNEAAEACFGYPRSEVVGRPCWKVLRGVDLSSNTYCGKTCSLRDMALRGEPVHRTQVVFRNANSAETRISLSVLVLRGDAGKELVHLCRYLSPCVEATPSPPYGPRANSHARLTERQLEVLKHLSDGKSTAEIAQLLGISSATVRHHIQHILGRLKVHGRLEAVALARRLGIL